MNTAETFFKDYLNKHNIPFWYIQQDQESYSKKIKEIHTKRPDFLIIIPNFTILFIDVKDKPPLKKYEKICLDYLEILQYNNLQKCSNIQIWYVVSNHFINYSEWFCIPATKIMNFKKFVVDEKYISIPVRAFTKLSSEESFYNLLKKY